MTDNPIDGILETALYVDDLDAAERFYGGVLSLPLINRAGNRHMFFSLGSSVLLIFNPDETEMPAPDGALPVPTHGTRGAGHACFRVRAERLDDMADRLRRAGVAIEADFRWRGGPRSIYFRDPAGNSLECAEPALWGLEQERQDMRKLETKTIVVASHNQGKIREIADLIGPFGFSAKSAAELNFIEPDETGTTFEENAAIKALASAKASGLPALSDDSGLVVDALDGDPGVYTANWAETADGTRDFQMAMQKVEDALVARGATKPAQRSARFVSVLCLAWPDGHTELFRGEIEGTVAWPPRGTSGFGYDPIFQPEGHERTFGEMTGEEKHGWKPGDAEALSHRARAFKRFVETCLEA